MNTAVKTYTDYTGFIQALRQAEANRMRLSSKDVIEGTELNFKPITHADMETIFQYLQMEKGRTTDFSYAGILMWVDYFKYEYAIADDTLFIKGVVENDTNTPAFSLPIGKMPMADAIALLKEECDEEGIALEFSAVPEYAVGDMQALGAREVIDLAHWGDYLYEIEPLATLHGKKMSKKRNHVNQFVAAYPDWQLIDLDGESLDLAREVMKLFESEGDDTPEAKAERRLTNQILEMFASSPGEMHGAVLMAGGKPCAVTVGDVKGDTLFVHIEKALREFQGSYEMINKEFAARMAELHPELKFVNREDDAGDEGLRQAKESYHPVEILKKYNVIF